MKVKLDEIQKVAKQIAELDRKSFVFADRELQGVISYITEYMNVRFNFWRSGLEHCKDWLKWGS